MHRIRTNKSKCGTNSLRIYLRLLLRTKLQSNKLQNTRQLPEPTHVPTCPTCPNHLLSWSPLKRSSVALANGRTWLPRPQGLEAPVQHGAPGSAPSEDRQPDGHPVGRHLTGHETIAGQLLDGLLRSKPDSLPLLLSKPKTRAGIHLEDLEVQDSKSISHSSSLHSQGFRPNLHWQSCRLTWENGELVPKKWLLSERPGEGLAKVLHLIWINILKIKEANCGEGSWIFRYASLKRHEKIWKDWVYKYGVCSSVTVERLFMIVLCTF